MSFLPTLSDSMSQTSHLAAEPLEYHTISLFGLSIHEDTVLVTFIWLVCIAWVCCVFFKNSLSAIPGRLQVAVEMFIGFFDDIAVGLGGKKMRKYLPFILSFFVFISVSNLIGLLPPIVKIHGIIITMPPTRDLNTTLALALVAFFTFQFVGYKEHGLGYLKHYLHPMSDIMPILPKWSYIVTIPMLAVFFIILNIVEEVSRVLSLTMRLMGNILGEHIVIGVMIGLVLITSAMAPLLAVFVDVMPFALQFMGVLTCIVQAFVFTLLTMSYVASAIEH